MGSEVCIAGSCLFLWRTQGKLYGQIRQQWKLHTTQSFRLFSSLKWECTTWHSYISKGGGHIPGGELLTERGSDSCLKPHPALQPVFFHQPSPDIWWETLISHESAPTSPSYMGLYKRARRAAQRLTLGVSHWDIFSQMPCFCFFVFFLLLKITYQCIRGWLHTFDSSVFLP